MSRGSNPVAGSAQSGYRGRAKAQTSQSSAGRRISRRAARGPGGGLPVIELLEQRLLLTAAIEVWGGNAD